MNTRGEYVWVSPALKKHPLSLSCSLALTHTQTCRYTHTSACTREGAYTFACAHVQRARAHSHSHTRHICLTCWLCICWNPTKYVCVSIYAYTHINLCVLHMRMRHVSRKNESCLTYECVTIRVCIFIYIYMYKYMCVRRNVCVCIYTCLNIYAYVCVGLVFIVYRVATISRLLKITGLFCKITL